MLLLKSVFDAIGKSSPSETTARASVAQLASQKGYPYTSQKNIFPKIICQKNISLNVLFPELTFVKNHTCQNEHLPEITSARMNTCLKLHLPE